MIGSFMTSGADELVIPVDLRLPFCIESSILFKEAIFLARSNGYTVRLHIDGIFESTEEECRRLIEHFAYLGITHLSILDGDNKCTPAFLSLMLYWIKDLVPKDRIALGFQSKDFSNIYTAFEEGITTYHTSLGGFGNYTNTLQLAKFAQEQHIEVPNIRLSHLHKTDLWWKRQLTTL
jgi:isopropylmalate/homocitrate/citramalate synthase